MPFLLLMPSYNQARYIADAVRSVVAQDDPDWQLWILDNSTDGTPDLMRGLDDPRIHFHHIPQRMDPGSCLNWMLERAQGEAFSYLHTDNNLRPDFVSRMRQALAGEPMGLAYCDMRTIGDDGGVTGLYRRGPFDFARLFSLEPLGVPFAATTALARAVGGFRPNDIADDVRFCASAYGIARYVHLPEPLLDYRVHGRSRWTEAGWPKIRQGFLDLFLELRPQLVARGAGDPAAALAGAVVERFAAVEQVFQELWDGPLSRALKPWWTEGRLVDHLFHAGFVRVPGFSGDPPKPPLRPLILGSGLRAAWPWQVYAAAMHCSRRREEIWALASRIQPLLLPWAYLSLGGHAQRIGVADTGFRSLLSARLLERELGWRPAIAAGARLPPWLGWPRASGDEPLLRFGDAPSLERRAA